MFIILDSNIYASDYRMKGVAFQTLFDYMRKTESRLVPPRIIREEVIADYGRRLKSESKDIAELWNRYRHLNLDRDPGKFRVPDALNEMKTLRRMMMKPSDGVKPVYVAETANVSTDEVFMRGVRRIRPSNANGEELRDVIIWLWSLAYCKATNSPTAFITQDSGFWSKDGIHADMERDLHTNSLMSLYRSIDDFAKQHSPAPVEAAPDWISANFRIQEVEHQLLDRVGASLRLRGIVRNIALEKPEFAGGSVYDVARSTQFAELQFSLVFGFDYFEQRVNPMQSRLGLGGWGLGGVGFSRPPSYLENLNNYSQRNLSGIDPKPELEALAQTPRRIKCEAQAQISVRVRKNQPLEMSVDKFKLDWWKLQTEIFRQTS